MIGRTPDTITVYRPLRDGVIANSRITQAMFKHFISKVNTGFRRFFKPDLLIGVPAGISSTEKRAVIQAGVNAGAKDVFVAKEPILSAIGAGVPINQASGHMIAVSYTHLDVYKRQDLELVNKEQHIATITDKKTELEIEITIEKGFGYKLVDDSAKEKKEIGVMELDKIFTPVRKVNYKVENVRVGKRTDFDKLILEIETDGIITPEQALLESIEILDAHFQFLKGDLSAEKQVKIKDLELSEKVMNTLKENDFKVVSDLTSRTEEELAVIKGIGKRGAKEIKKVLESLKLNFKL